MKVLIVDDDFVNRKLLKKMMESMSSTDGVSNGREAVQAFVLAHEEKDPYDLILLDIQMPELDGQETLREIRTWESDHHIFMNDGVKFIMVTSKDDAKSIMQAFTNGCEGYVTKPVTKDKIFNEMKKLEIIE